VVLDDALVAEARQVLGGTTLRGLLEMALREAVKAHYRQMLIRAIDTGEFELEMTEEELKEMRKDRPVVAEWVAHGMGGGADPEPQAPLGSSGRKASRAARRQSA
jgi:hypothetical protein